MIQTKVTENSEEEKYLCHSWYQQKYANVERRTLHLKRGQWLFKNRLHYRIDVTLGEDVSQVCS